MTAGEATMVSVRYRIPGFHHWPGAFGKRAYLAHSHRHLFWVEVQLQVWHDEREVEFHDLLDISREAWPGEPNADLGPLSCESLAKIVADKVTARFGGRAVVVSVYEDGEVGAVIRRG